MDTPAWPALPLEAWQKTSETLHLWFQVVGKVRLKQSPWINHSWHATLYVTPTGLTTSGIACGEHGFEIRFDFRRHLLEVQVSDGSEGSFALEPMAVATFYRKLMTMLKDLGVPVAIYHRPNEVADSIPFEDDEVHRSYDPEYANRFWRVLLQADRVFKIFRARFIGKCSPVHFFWGSADLAVTRFSGRLAPEHPGGIPNLPDWITREAYSHEVCSAGFWWGGPGLPYPMFYSYSYPEPEGYKGAAVQPKEAFHHAELGEFVLPYDAVRLAQSPDDALLAFLQSTYEAAARFGHWDRQALEKTQALPPSGAVAA
jgi:hypothetical protein